MTSLRKPNLLTRRHRHLNLENLAIHHLSTPSSMALLDLQDDELEALQVKQSAFQLN
jgi:hypothetical protein